MDFFATGGFQQLFCDLDEHVIEHDYHVMEAHYSKLTTTTNNQALLHFDRTWSIQSDVTDIIPKNDYFFGTDKQVHCCEIINVKDKINEATEKQLLDVSVATSDWNNNVYQDAEIQLNEKQLQYSLDLLLPMIDEEATIQAETDDLSTDYFITREMADWEERFLDNYIEIPELIDFLPEKTPLCTDECELFLHESTKNLRLHSKRKQAISCDTQKSGYTCTFGDCRKVYAKPAHLKAHLRRHLGEKPYVCNWPDCTWRFSRSDELARHRRSHSGVKPYKCDYCTKCFARSDHLTKHRKVHERRLLAASKAGKVLDGAALPYSILTVRPGRKRKNQIC